MYRLVSCQNTSTDYSQLPAHIIDEYSDFQEHHAYKFKDKWHRKRLSIQVSRSRSVAVSSQLLASDVYKRLGEYSDIQKHHTYKFKDKRHRKRANIQASRY